MPKRSASTPKFNIKAGIMVVAMLLLVSFSYYFYQLFYTPNIDTKGSREILYIKTGATYDEVMKDLESRGYVIDKLALRFLAKLMDYPKLVKPGRYIIEDQLTNYQLITKLRSGRQDPAKLTFNNIRIKEQLAAKLSEAIEADSVELLKALRDPQLASQLGFDTTTIMCMFIPNTYEIYWTTSTNELFKRMKKEHESFWNDSRKSKAEQQKLSPSQVCVLASIVEAESQKKDERPRIAGVYLNRLNKNMLLQADPTVVFAAGDFTIRRVLNYHLQIDSPYNTYKYAGLPPGPINLASISSIDAVLNAEKHNYLYFCAKEDFSGYHSFAATMEQHLENARRYQKALNQAKIMK